MYSQRRSKNSGLYRNLYLSQCECLFRYVPCPNGACIQCCHFTFTVSCNNIFEPSAIVAHSACWTLCRTSHIVTSITTVFFPLHGFCLSHKGPVNLLNTVIPARMISFIVGLFHVLDSSCSLSCCRRAQNWRLSWLFSPLLLCTCNCGAWTISQVDLYSIWDGTGTPTTFMQMLFWLCPCVWYVTMEWKLWCKHNCVEPYALAHHGWWNRGS